MIDLLYTKDAGYDNSLRYLICSYERGNKYDEAILRAIEAMIECQPSCYNCKYFESDDEECFICKAHNDELMSIEEDGCDGRKCNEYEYDEERCKKWW